MSRIDAQFAGLRREKGKALIAYVTVGFPRVSILTDLVKAMEGEVGVDIVELGVPFSDPLADGPTIQAASTQALGNGVTPRVVFRMMENLRRNRIIVPVALLTYANPVLRYGIKRFCRDALLSGADGFIVPDLPPEEAKELIEESRPLGLNTIFLASPTSPPSRLRRIAKASTGFIYYVSLTGVTGARASLPREVTRQVQSIKRMTEIPVCVGFGISRASQVRQMARVADGVIIGSALLDAMGTSRSPVRAAVNFLKPLRRACR